MKPYHIAVVALVLFIAIASCKKDSPIVLIKTGNYQHDLSNKYYLRGLLDTTWAYFGTDDTTECQTTGKVCAQFSGTPAALHNMEFYLMDSAFKSPQDSVIRDWAHQSFSFFRTGDTLRPYSVSFSYLDSFGHKLSTEYTDNTTSAFHIDTIMRDGQSVSFLDSAHHPYKLYRVQGSMNCNVAHYNDTTHVKVSQGVYSIRIMEGKR